MKPVIVRTSIETDWGSEVVDIEIDRSEWDALDVVDQAKLAMSTAQQTFFNACNYGFEVVL